ncbi:uncharacterized protein DS421_15g491650 [Arachis hypogaea]|nr:uncharacterized protein DS421_15g491650 [Arachis hypogaea]
MHVLPMTSSEAGSSYSQNAISMFYLFWHIFSIDLACLIFQREKLKYHHILLF